MIKRDDMMQWKDLLEPMINWMSSNQKNAIQSGLDTFCVILNEMDDRVHVILPKLIPTLYKMSMKADVSLFLT